MNCTACGKSLADAEPTSIGVIVSIKDDHGTYHSGCWGHSLTNRIAKLEAALREIAGGEISGYGEIVVRSDSMTIAHEALEKE